MTTTLASLVTPITQQQWFSTLLGLYQAAGFPVQAWQPFGVERTRLMAIATGLASLSNYVPAIAGGSLLDYAPNFPGWMALTAPEIFSLTPNPATFTVGNILATNNATVSYSYSPTSPLIAVFAASGNRYFSQGSGTIPAGPGGTLSIQFQAENAGASYADPSNSGALTLSTALAGVTLTNPTTNYTSVTHVGSGTGTLTLGGSPVGPHQVVISVTATSAGNPATVSYSLDGAAAISLGAISSVTNLGGTGINITFVAGGSGTSWVNGDTYSFSTPASWITSQGANAETDIAVASRCRNRWSSLSPIPTVSLYQLLAQSTPSVGAQVTQVFVVPDSVINNKINIVIAGPGGVLPAGVITSVQNFINPYARGCDNPVVQSPTTLGITIAATITVLASQSAAAQSAITTALNNYIASIPVNGTIKLSAIEALLVPNPITGVGGVSGVTDISGLTINSVAANLTLGTPTTFVLPAYPPTLTLSYVTQ